MSKARDDAERWWANLADSLDGVTSKRLGVELTGYIRDAVRAEIAAALAERPGAHAASYDAYVASVHLRGATEVLDLVERPGPVPVGAPGSVQRRAWEIGEHLERLRDGARQNEWAVRLAALNDALDAVNKARVPPSDLVTWRNAALENAAGRLIKMIGAAQRGEELRKDAAGWRRVTEHQHRESYDDEVPVTVCLLGSAAEALEAEADLRVALLAALGQLRHLYDHMINDRVVDLRAAADGLLAPAIRRIETALAPPTPRAAEDGAKEPTQ